MVFFHGILIFVVRKCERTLLFHSVLHSSTHSQFNAAEPPLGRQSSKLQNVQICPTIPKSDSILGTTFYHFTFAPPLSYLLFAFTTPSAYFATSFVHTKYVSSHSIRHNQTQADRRGWRYTLPSAGAKQCCLGRSCLGTEFYHFVTHQACATDGRRFIVGAGARQPRVKSKIQAPQQPGFLPPFKQELASPSRLGLEGTAVAGRWRLDADGPRRKVRRGEQTAALASQNENKKGEQHDWANSRKLGAASVGCTLAAHGTRVHRRRAEGLHPLQCCVGPAVPGGLGLHHPLGHIRAEDGGRFESIYQGCY